jgi:hypothetical protein
MRFIADMERFGRTYTRQPQCFLEDPGVGLVRADFTGDHYVAKERGNTEL